MIAARLRPPLAAQVGAVVALFVAAIGTLWVASTSVVGREERRARASDRLREAGNLLERIGREALAGIRPYPEYIAPEEWDAIDRLLIQGSARAREAYPDVEGGYYVPSRREPPFLYGLAQVPAPAGGQGLYDAVETQADAAYRKEAEVLVVEDVPPQAVAIRAVPIRLDGRLVAATWTMTRLVDPIFLGRAAAGDRLFAGLALGGIALSLGLTYSLVRTVRRQARERDRLQLDLRRSERLAALGKLLAGVAHEVRNPLAGIRSTAQLWQRGLGGGAESLAGLVEEVDRLEEIVSRLLQFSRADAQDLAPGDLNAVLAEAARLAAGPAEARGIRVEVDLQGDLPPAMMAPPAVLQVVRNLTTNATQAMPGGGTLRLRSRHDPSRGVVLASVSDTGAGLSPEAIGHLFEPFYTTKAEGTGLGLAIAREIALAHRGDLRAGNKAEGPGAVFTLSLPVAPAGGTR